MTKETRQKLKYLESKKSFWGEIKGIFHHFKGFLVAQIFSDLSVPLKWYLAYIWSKEKFITIKVKPITCVHLSPECFYPMNICFIKHNIKHRLLISQISEIITSVFSIYCFIKWKIKFLAELQHLKRHNVYSAPEKLCFKNKVTLFVKCSSLHLIKQKRIWSWCCMSNFSCNVNIQGNRMGSAS